MRPMTGISRFPAPLDAFSQAETIPIDVKLATMKNTLLHKHTISKYTTQQNTNLTSSLVQVGEMEKFDMLKKTNAKYQDINCNALIVKANREIKCLSYKLQKIIP
jgi:hypothetical protein